MPRTVPESRPQGGRSPGAISSPTPDYDPRPLLTTGRPGSTLARTAPISCRGKNSTPRPAHLDDGRAVPPCSQDVGRPVIFPGRDSVATDLALVEGSASF